MFNLFGQVKEHEIKLRDKLGNPKLIEFKETKVANQAQSIQSFLNQQFKGGDKIEFRHFNNLAQIKSTLSESHKYQQYYKGIKVEHGKVNVLSKNGNLTKILGRYVDIKNLTTAPAITEQQAFNFALQFISARKYAWEDESFEQFLKNEQNNPNATFYPKGELVIVEKNPSSDRPIPRLTFKFNIYALNPISRAHYYVDAENGEILMVDAILKHVEGIAQTRYSGTKTIETELFNGQYRLNDVSRGNGIHTYNMNNSGNYSLSTDLFDNDNNWTSEEYNNSSKDNSLLDAHWGAIKTYDYFLIEHNRNSVDSKEFQIRNYVNADLTKISSKYQNSDNALWDGQRMTYGIGTSLNPFVSLDVIAHEIGHGLDQFTSDLEYQGESGAIEESLSDIWGAMVEYFAAPEKATYLLGEDVGFVIRSLSNPKDRNQPDTYGGQFWLNPNCGEPTDYNDKCGVHTNSGIMNHWFYLLAEGSSSTDGINDNMGTFNITGIGKEKAAQIVYYDTIPQSV